MVLDSPLKPTVCRQRLFNWGERTFVMGIVNLSPDSFSGDGLRTIDAAVEQAKRFVAEGAGIIRVHDVKFMSRVAKMSDGVIRRKTQ
jgi:dihydropteroate synthase